MLQALRHQLESEPDPSSIAPLRAAYAAALPTTDGNAVAATRDQLVDNFLALYIAPQPDRPSLIELGEALRMLDLTLRIIAGDLTLEESGAVARALSLPLLLATKLFRFSASRIHPVGIADLLLVKQHIERYELGEIARVENILKGESRDHTQKRTLTTSTSTTVDQTSTTETSSELTTSDTVSLKTEIDKSLKEDFNLRAGVQVSVHGPAYEKRSHFSARSRAP